MDAFLFFLFLLSLLPIGLFSNPCLNVNVCDCTDTVVSCRCHGSHLHLNILPIGLTIRPQKMFISDCHKVEFMSHVISSLDSLSHLEIKNVSVLLILPYAMSNMHNYKRILFQDTVIHTLPSYAFNNMTNIERLTFKNVSIKKIHEEAFSSIKNMQQLIFTESMIEELHPNVFNDTASIDNLIFESTFIALVEEEALTLRDVTKLIFQDCRVSHWASRAIVVSNVTHVLFNKSRLGILKSNAWVATQGSFFEVIDCDFKKVNDKAFWELRDATLSLRKNKFQVAKNGSLLTYTMDVSKWIINENYLPCDHSICWLFDDFFYEIYGTFIASSKCHLPDSEYGQPLASVKLKLDDEDFCDENEFSGSNGLEHEKTTETMHAVVTEIKLPSLTTSAPSTAHTFNIPKTIATTVITLSIFVKILSFFFVTV